MHIWLLRIHESLKKHTLLSTFAWKSSNIDFFLKLSPLWNNELVMSEMREMGVAGFVAEIRCPKDQPKSDKSVFVTEYASNFR